MSLSMIMLPCNPATSTAVAAASHMTHDDDDA